MFAPNMLMIREQRQLERERTKPIEERMRVRELARMNESKQKASRSFQYERKTLCRV